MDGKKLISIRNRNNGITTYQLPEQHIVRQFGVGETKKVPFEELQALQYAPGGAYMLDNLLVVEDKDALETLNMKVEPEYFYNESNVRKLLLSGSYDEFADFLDFAPDGALEMAKDIAVKEQIPDSKKRKMLTEKTGFSIDNAITVNTVLADENENKPVEEPVTKQRRVQITETSNEPQRRVELPQYKVVSKN